MRIARLSPPEGEKLVIWDRVIGVRYVAEGLRRFIVLTYRGGSERHLETHQARDLWYDVNDTKGCPAPCYHRHESETSPDECMCCQLAECLEGLDCKVRPAALPPRRRRRPDWRNPVILILLAIVLLLIAALDLAAHRPRSSPTPAVKAPDEAPSKGAGGSVERVGEGR